MSLTIHGHVAPGFEPVLEAFRENFVDRGEVGASVAAWVRGEPVVDLWAGEADRDRHEPWSRDTMAVMFSATKGLVALAFLMLEDRGLLDVDKPVAWYWPEFGRHGKSGITVRTWLNHRSGVSAVETPVPLTAFRDDPRSVEAAVVDQRPLWTPGSRQGYGATAFGLVAQPLFQRIAGETLGTFLRREVFEPLGADVHLGLPPGHDSRVATLYPVPPASLLRAVLPEVVTRSTTEGRLYRDILLDPRSPARLAFLNPKLGRGALKVLNEPWVRALELPWMGAIGTARGLATVYSALGQGGRHGAVRLVRKAALERVARKQSWSVDDAVLHKPLGFSQGFNKDEAHLLSPNEAAIGHTGAGGSVGFADPIHGLGFAYLMNRMDHRVRSPRMIALVRATYRALGQE